jgi:hypothetical protein
MSDNNDPRDHLLSRLYREGAWPEPSRQIDQAILAASRRASRERHPLLWRWAPSFAIAATVVVTSAVVLKVYREQPAALEYYSAQEKTAARAKPFTREPKPAEAKVEATSVTPPAPVPQAPATPQGFSSTMDAAEAARVERAQRDMNLKDVQPAGTAPLTRPASTAKAPATLKKETAEPSPTANLERRADSPQTPSAPVSVFGAAPPAPAPARAQAARAAVAKPAQTATQNTQNTPQAAPPAEATPAPAAEGDTLSKSAVGALTVAPAAKTAERSPQTWLEDIRKLVKEGRLQEADAEMVRFKKRYPDYVLPEDLR